MKCLSKAYQSTFSMNAAGHGEHSIDRLSGIPWVYFLGAYEPRNCVPTLCQYCCVCMCSSQERVAGLTETLRHEESSWAGQAYPGTHPRACSIDQATASLAYANKALVLTLCHSLERVQKWACAPPSHLEQNEIQWIPLQSSQK